MKKFIFCYALFGSIDIFSKCCGCCECCCCDGGEKDVFTYLPVDCHKYDSWPEGYFFISFTSPEDVFYISSKDGRFYTALQGPEDKKEIKESDTNWRTLRAKCCGLGHGGGVIYYNGKFGQNVNVGENIRLLNKCTPGDALFSSVGRYDVVSPNSVFLDREGTGIVLLLNGIHLLITKDNISFSDDKDYKDPCKEIFSQEQCSVCSYSVFEIYRSLSASTGIYFYLHICLRCGTKKCDIVDDNKRPVAEKNFLNVLSCVASNRHLLNELVRDMKCDETKFVARYKNQPHQLEALANLTHSKPPMMVLWVKQFYIALKKLWNM